MSVADDLRERVRLEAPEYDGDAYGGADVSWQLVGEYFAHIEALGTRQARSAAGQLEYQPHYRITLRAPRALTSDMRFIWRGSVLAIDAIIPQSRMVEISCHEERV